MSSLITDEIAADMRRRLPMMIKYVTTWDACSVFSEECGCKAETAYRVIMNRSHKDPDYTPTRRKYICPKCGRKLEVHKFYYGKPFEKQHICERCHASLSAPKRFKRRDSYDDEQYHCPVCGLGVSELGKVFPTQAEADLCCGDAAMAKGQGGCQPTPGKYIRTWGRLPHGGRVGKYIAAVIKGFGSKHMQYGKQYEE